MRSLAEISKLNSLASIAKEKFLANALNNPKDFHPRKPRISRAAKVVERGNLFNAEDLKTLGEPWRAA